MSLLMEFGLTRWKNNQLEKLELFKLVKILWDKIPVELEQYRKAKFSNLYGFMQFVDRLITEYYEPPIKLEDGEKLRLNQKFVESELVSEYDCESFDDLVEKMKLLAKAWEGFICLEIYEGQTRYEVFFSIDDTDKPSLTTFVESEFSRFNNMSEDDLAHYWYLHKKLGKHGHTSHRDMADFIYLELGKRKATFMVENPDNNDSVKEVALQ